jgi:hypothetical protein
MLGLTAGVSIWSISALITWMVTRVFFSSYRKSFEADELILTMQAQLLGTSVINAAMRLPKSTYETLRAIIDGITGSLPRLLPLLLIAGLSLVWLDHHDDIIASALRTRQCWLLPAVHDFLMPLLNLLNLLYSTLWPLVNVWAEILWFYSSGAYRILRSCSSLDDIMSVITTLSSAVVTFVQDLLTFMDDGGFFSNRLSLVPTMIYIGAAVAYLVEPLNCFCAWLNSVWVFLTSIPQQTSFHEAVEAVVNLAIRGIQWLLQLFTSLEFPMFSLIAEELIVAVLSAGDLIEDINSLFWEMLLDLYLEFAIAIEAHTDSLSELKLATDSSSSSKLATTFHAALRTWASPLRPQEAIVVQREKVSIATPLWQIPEEDLDLEDLWGATRLLALLATPWSRIFTEPVAAAIVVANQSVNAILHPTEAFGSSTGIAFFQVGEAAGHVRASVDAAASLLVLFQEELPCVGSNLGQAVITLAESVVEIIIAFSFFIRFPRWAPGVPDPCEFVTCEYPAEPEWSIFDFFPLYASWSASGLTRTLELLQDDADCVAVTLGCNSTTLADDNCTDLPFQCATRQAYLLLIEYVNQTQLFFFYIPDLVRFDGSGDYKTFQDLSTVRIAELWTNLIECLVRWYVFLSFFFISGTGKGGEIYFKHWLARPWTPGYISNRKIRTEQQTQTTSVPRSSLWSSPTTAVAPVWHDARRIRHGNRYLATKKPNRPPKDPLRSLL